MVLNGIIGIVFLASFIPDTFDLSRVCGEFRVFLTFLSGSLFLERRFIE